MFNKEVFKIKYYTQLFVKCFPPILISILITFLANSIEKSLPIPGMAVIFATIAGMGFWEVRVRVWVRVTRLGLG
jgi:hypothetical protein